MHDCRQERETCSGKASAVATYTFVNIQFQLFLRDALLDPLAEGGIASRADTTIPVVDEATTLSVKRGGRRTIPAIFLCAETIHRSLPPASVDERQTSPAFAFANLRPSLSARPIPPWARRAFKETSGGSPSKQRWLRPPPPPGGFPRGPEEPLTPPSRPGAPGSGPSGWRLPSPPRGIAFPLQPADALRLPRPGGDPSLASNPSERRRKRRGSFFSPPHGLPTPPPSPGSRPRTASLRLPRSQPPEPAARYGWLCPAAGPFRGARQADATRRS